MESWLGRWWGLRRKRRALRHYVEALGPTLAKDYGREETYSVARIKTALRKHGFSEEFETHALAMYSSKNEFVAELGKIRVGFKPRNVDERYDELRLEAASLANNDSTRFMPKHWEDVGMNNGSDEDARSRWGIGL